MKPEILNMILKQKSLFILANFIEICIGYIKLFSSHKE